MNKHIVYHSRMSTGIVDKFLLSFFKKRISNNYIKTVSKFNKPFTISISFFPSVTAMNSSVAISRTSYISIEISLDKAFLSFSLTYLVQLILKKHSSSSLLPRCGQYTKITEIISSFTTSSNIVILEDTLDFYHLLRQFFFTITPTPP